MSALGRRELIGASVVLLTPRLAHADEAATPATPAASPGHVPAPSNPHVTAPSTAGATTPSSNPTTTPPTEVAPGTSDAPLGTPVTDRDRTVASTYVIPVPGIDLVIGGAVIDVRAPLADVKNILGAFHRYKEILPRIQQSRVVAEEGDKTDVYLRAPILHGLAAIWGVARFGPFEPYKTRGLQRRGDLVSGNIEKWSGRWMAFPCGERRTLLKLEIFCQLSIPMPSRVVNKWLLWACRKGVTAVRDMAECGTSGVAKD